MKEQLLTAWQIHNSKNLLLLQHLPEEGLQSRLGTRGRNIAEQLLHLHATRLAWLQSVAKTLYNPNQQVAKNATLSKTLMQNAFTQSGATVEALIYQSWEKGGKLPSFSTGLIPFIGYLIAHEAHHRGQVLLTIKQSGFPLPDELKWGLWEWSKIPVSDSKF